MCYCSNGSYFDGKKADTRVCSKCKYSESATARTVFHKVKFSLRKAFHIVYMMSCNQKGVSSHEISRQLSLRQKSCWYFQSKVQAVRGTQRNNALAGQVGVDEFFVGGPEEGKPGRGSEEKELVVIAIQVDPNGIHRCYAKVIENAGADELGDVSG